MRSWHWFDINYNVCHWGRPLEMLLCWPGLAWSDGPTPARQSGNKEVDWETGRLCQFYLQIEIFHWELRLWRILDLHNKLSSLHWSLDLTTTTSPPSILLILRGRGRGRASHCQQINQSTKKRESLFSDELWLISRLSASVNNEK